MFKLMVFTWHKKMHYESAAITELFKNGMEILHIRKPTFTQNEMKNLIEAIPKEYRSKIILHDFPNLAIKYKLAGAVYPQRMLFNTKLPSGMSRCFSGHAFEDFNRVKYKVDYYLLSPVYAQLLNSVSKTNWTLAQLTNFLNEHPEKEIIALGGVTPDKFPQVKELGFKGAAVLGYLWKEFSSDGDMQQLLARFSEVKDAYRSIFVNERIVSQRV